MNQDHVFIDLAVTHPNPEIGQIIAVAAVRTDKKGKVITEFAEKIRLHEDLSTVEEAHSPPDFSVTEWTQARRLPEVMSTLRETLLIPFDGSYVVVATHADVDRRFFKEAWKTHNCNGPGGSPFQHRAWIDPLQLAWPMFYNDMMPDRSFDSLCKHFGVNNSAPDTATGDCAALVEVYWAMMNRYKGALIGEEVIREVGGNALAHVRRFFGT